MCLSYVILFSVIFCPPFLLTANGNEVIGILGSSVELECHYVGEKSLDKLRVLWQTNKPVPCLVDAYFPNKREKKNLCEEFRNRTQINKENFSLKLLHVTIKDERTYECIVQRNKTMQFEVEDTTTVTLKVAGKHFLFSVNVYKLQICGPGGFIVNSSSYVKLCGCQAMIEEKKDVQKTLVFRVYP